MNSAGSAARLSAVRPRVMTRPWAACRPHRSARAPAAPAAASSSPPCAAARPAACPSSDCPTPPAPAAISRSRPPRRYDAAARAGSRARPPNRGRPAPRSASAAAAAKAPTAAAARRRDRQQPALALDHHAARLGHRRADQRDPQPPVRLGARPHPFGARPRLAEAAPGEDQPHPPRARRRQLRRPRPHRPMIFEPREHLVAKAPRPSPAVRPRAAPRSARRWRRPAAASAAQSPPPSRRFISSSLASIRRRAAPGSAGASAVAAHRRPMRRQQRQPEPIRIFDHLARGFRLAAGCHRPPIARSSIISFEPGIALAQRHLPAGAKHVAACAQPIDALLAHVRPPAPRPARSRSATDVRGKPSSCARSNPAHARIFRRTGASSPLIHAPVKAQEKGPQRSLARPRTLFSSLPCLCRSSAALSSTLYLLVSSIP